MDDQEVPALLPARMINEAAYCERLYYIEWVQGRFAHNADTAAGVSVHRRVDLPGGELPATDDEAPRATRSVALSSEELGLIATIDLVESSDGTVRPIDYKKSRAPKIPEGAYEPELLQLCVQGLLLRQAGYTCDSGILYFAGSRTRVEIDFDADLISRTHDLIARAREVAARADAPPPLVDSPKCPRCSLVGLCLPDETNTLAARADRPPRRLIPSDDAARPLYVTVQGAWIGVSGGRFEITKNKEKLASTRLIDVSQICIYGNAQISTQALRAAFREEIPVCFFSYGGWFTGLAEGLPGKHVELRRRQVMATVRGDVPTAAAFVSGKIRNSRTLLRRNAREGIEEVTASLTKLAEQARSCTSTAELLGMEGAAARMYFASFNLMLRPDLREPLANAGTLLRTRRPPQDPVNCMLSYCYSLLVKDLTATCYSVGLDPYVGLYHRARFGRPALALDLMEEFRPLLADSVVISLVNNGEVDADDFVRRGLGVALRDAGRRSVLAAYERRLSTEVTHPMFGYTVSYHRPRRHRPEPIRVSGQQEPAPSNRRTDDHMMRAVQ